MSVVVSGRLVVSAKLVKGRGAELTEVVISEKMKEEDVSGKVEVEVAPLSD